MATKYPLTPFGVKVKTKLNTDGMCLVELAAKIGETRQRVNLTLRGILEPKDAERKIISKIKQYFEWVGDEDT